MIHGTNGFTLVLPHDLATCRSNTEDKLRASNTLDARQLHPLVRPLEVLTY
jgi:hypothetical protein